jgi:NAD(P)-dependent dehydrogenase (short-subunit alcohol dehydrogenase family)
LNTPLTFSLAGKVTLVTGGATGIGYAIAAACQAHGAKVYIGGRREDLGAKAAEKLGATYLPLDVHSTESVDAAIARIVSERGRIDIGINGAGARLNKAAEDTTDQEWADVFETNITGIFRCCRAEGRAMLNQGAGTIVNIASMSAHAVNRPQRQAAYNASKAAVVQYSKSLAGEWADRHIRVNSISPGYTETAMTAGSRSKPEMVAVWLGNTPMARVAKPDEIAGAAVYLASDASSFVTGHDLVVDGGYTVW